MSDYIMNKEANRLATDGKLVHLIYRSEMAKLQKSRVSALEPGRLDALLDRARRRVPGENGAQRLDKIFFIVTRACQLRCGYCSIWKYGKYMSEPVLDHAIKFIMYSPERELQLHFFGGEPLLGFDLIKKAVHSAERLKVRRGKRIRYLITTNGIALKSDMVEFFKKYDFTVVVSCDGAGETFIRQRPGIREGNFHPKVLAALSVLKKSKIDYYVTAVVSPDSASKLEENVYYLVDMGHERVEITYEVGREWSSDSVKTLLDEMGRLMERAERSRAFHILNATDSRFEPTIAKSELALDFDGRFYRHIGLLLGEGLGLSTKDFLVGDLSSECALSTLGRSVPDDLLLLFKACEKRGDYLRKIILNNMNVGWMLADFIRLNKNTQELRPC